ncbi:MAG: dephospho-CoA kinase [Ruminococcaceae bacterium]|nr:dephospho-CoA kinase [Oscillospiraceae bacterium]
MNSKKIYGLTGMSGAGKTTVSEVFKENGFEVINCDMVAREVTEKGTACLKEIAEKFDGVLNPDGTLDRKKLGSIVFSDKEKLKLLNDTIYPFISYRVIKGIENTDNNYVLLDAPTLFESGIDFICDGVVSVVCDKELSVKRIMARDNISEEAAESRLSSQHDKSFYKEKSSFCIENNDTADVLQKKAEEIARQIKRGI